MPVKRRKGFCRLVVERIGHFERLGKKKTADNYACALRHFRQFKRGKDIAVEELSAAEMIDFQAYLISEGLKMNTVSLYNRELRAVYHYALDEEIIQTDRRPFRKSFTGRERTRKRAVDGGVVKRLVPFPLSVGECLDLPATCSCSAYICRECLLLIWPISERPDKERLCHLPTT